MIKQTLRDLQYDKEDNLDFIEENRDYDDMAEEVNECKSELKEINLKIAFLKAHKLRDTSQIPIVDWYKVRFASKPKFSPICFLTTKRKKK
jgi:hypothetical protein